jgi:hypothetical protein
METMKTPFDSPAGPRARKTAFVFWLLWSATAMASTEEHLAKSFAVQSDGKLVVEVDMGSIQVATNGGKEVQVDVWRKIGRTRKADEEAYLKEHPVLFSQDGNTITVRCRNKSNSSWNFTGRNQNEAKYLITVPAQFNARLGTSGGGISVKDLIGEVKAETSAGGLEFFRLRGPLDGSTSGGGVHVTDCEGKLRVETSAGGITVTGGSGSLKADTSGGPVEVTKFHGPANLQTSAGGITIEGVTGEIRGETSGGGIRASLPSPIIAPVKLETSAGGITVRVPSNAAFDLDAITSAGSVSSDLPVTVPGKQEHDHLKGTVNGGGKPIVLRTSGGGIHLLKAEPVLAEEPVAH